MTTEELGSDGLQTHTVYIQGMHCNACVLLTESELGACAEVTNVHANLTKRSVEVTGAFRDKTAEDLVREFSPLLAPHGYRVSLVPEEQTVAWSEFLYAVPLALGFVALFVGLQSMGIVNLVGGGEVTYGTAFLVGVVASLSTCMAVVGGLVLSLSATFAKGGGGVLPQLMFHGARLVSFFLLGGLIGMLGAVVTLSSTVALVLGLGVGIVMLLLGLHLLDVFPWVRRLQPALPAWITKRAQRATTLNHTLTPLVAGVATFFLPCGFTQSMQLYTLTTGDFWSGGLTMFVFALGTLPVLAAVSFTSYRLTGSARAGVFFKAAGIVVILFALFNSINSLVAAGIIVPLYSL